MSEGRILTFYSYKGGVGRTMTVANVGRLLAREHTVAPAKTLLIDWDLEAPSLHRFFKAADEPVRGLVDYFEAFVDLLANREDFREGLRNEGRAAILNQALPLEPYLVEADTEGLFLMAAGPIAKIASSEYQGKVASFDWVGLFREHRYAFEAFREMLAARFAYTLIDSRTGIGDISGVCTAILPDKLIAMFAPNSQNTMVIKVVEAALEFRRLSDDLRPLIVYPLASRCDPADLTALQTSLNGFQSEFADLFKRAYELRDCDLSRYFEEVILLYVPWYAYNERIAVEKGEPTYVGSLRRSYTEFCKWLVSDKYPWADGPQP
ncbi:MAG: hypothetical protein ABSG65_23790 [Bryobacteraceae bacterium]|jgi:MinD-like ATPase involved in chromosome partitioning or flagellar assembly